MRKDLPAPERLDTLRTTPTVVFYSGADFAAVINGQANGTDLGRFCVKCTHTHEGASLRFKWHSGFLDKQPRPGEIVRLGVGGVVVFTGVVDAINGYTEERGTRHMEVTARTRDQVGIWRREHLNTRSFATGTDLGLILAEICADIGLSDNEYVFPATGLVQPHASLQLGDMTIWRMFTDLLLPSGDAPHVDALGVFRRYSKEVTRPADISLPKERVVRIEGSKTSLPVSTVRLKWLDRNLTKVKQQDQPVGTVNITAGFFKLRQERQVFFSGDHTQRAENSYMVVKQSVNSGLLPVGDEEWRPRNLYYGDVVVTTDAWVPTLATAALAALLAHSHIPDKVVTEPTTGVGETIPVGRPIQVAANIAILLIMMSLGTGIYEIRAEPFDFVHARNTTEAVNDDSPVWAYSVKEIENDLMWDEGHAQEVAIRELLYESAAVNAWGAEIVDDPRLEVGDIVELPDRSRLFITGYSRELTRGAPATLRLEGFRV